MNSFLEKHSDAVMPEPNSGCLLWTLGTTSAGYGVAYDGGIQCYAHRAVFEAAHGVGSAAGVIVRHKCDTPACVNPDHLIGGTRADNIRDCHERGRTNYRRGERHQFAKLTDAKVVDFRKRASQGESPDAMASEVGMAVQAVKQAIRGYTWTHLPNPVKI